MNIHRGDQASIVCSLADDLMGESQLFPFSVYIVCLRQEME